MKEIESRQRKKTELIQKKQQEQRQHFVFAKSLHPHNNHKVWEINTITGEVKAAEFHQKREYLYNPNWKPGDPIDNGKTLVRLPGFEYVSALNAQTALKKYRDGKDGSKYDKNKTISINPY